MKFSKVFSSSVVQVFPFKSQADAKTVCVERVAVKTTRTMKKEIVFLENLFNSCLSIRFIITSCSFLVFYGHFSCLHLQRREFLKKVTKMLKIIEKLLKKIGKVPIWGREENQKN